jgi:hypothetical protein
VSRIPGQDISLQRLIMKSVVFSGTYRERKNKKQNQHAFSYDFLIEVLCSYRLIFGQHKGSLSRFGGIKPLLHRDPLLKLLCDTYSEDHKFYGAYEAGSSKTIYPISSDFSPLGRRLFKLQNFMNKQNPSDIKTLWYDRRDVVKFYTFWAVFLLWVV